MTGDPTIDDTVIEALRGQQRRYDVAIDSELVLSVLPNGVKTWTWVYDDPADPHRKTLGIYPDMTLEDAKKSLAAEKAAYRRAAAEASPEFVIRDGRIQPAEPSPSQLPIIAGAVALVVTGAILAWFFTGGEDDIDSGENPFVENTAAPGGGPAKADIQLPNVTTAGVTAGDTTTSIANAGNADADTALPERVPPARLDERLGGLSPTPESPPDVAQPAPTAEDLAAVAGNIAEVPDNTADDDPTPDIAAIGDANAAVTETTAAESNDAALSETAPPAPATNDTALREAPPAPPRTADASSTDSVVGMRVADDMTVNQPVLDERISRGHLTSLVSQREPVDDLGTAIIGNGEDLQTYYFYTELRELSGQRVRHRWIHNDRVIAEVPFDVGEAWRWRVYSSKTFIPSMAGPWRVQVLLEDETVIYNLPFDFTP